MFDIKHESNKTLITDLNILMEGEKRNDTLSFANTIGKFRHTF